MRREIKRFPEGETNNEKLAVVVYAAKHFSRLGPISQY